ncbi:DUF3006 domain-containing protein [Candidatus Falkowbacteria bacterium]|nr:DUF3006 domain-containing protein [Candidatus Falkowbacteria bacterium]
MLIELTIDRFEGDKAVLKTDDGNIIVWPKNKLPAGVREGAILYFDVKNNSEAEKEKREVAKEMLNEIMGQQ